MFVEQPLALPGSANWVLCRYYHFSVVSNKVVVSWVTTLNQYFVLSFFLANRSMLGMNCLTWLSIISLEFEYASHWVIKCKEL